MSTHEHNNDDTDVQDNDQLDHPTPSLDAVLRIYDDARTYLNVAREREVPPGGRIDEDEFAAQLVEEGYTKAEAENILDLFERRGDLTRDLDGVAPTVLQITVGETEVSA
jgi:hypothetical protein